MPLLVRNIRARCLWQSGYAYHVMVRTKMEVAGSSLIRTSCRCIGEGMPELSDARE